MGKNTPKKPILGWSAGQIQRQRFFNVHPHQPLPVEETSGYLPLIVRMS